MPFDVVPVVVMPAGVVSTVVIPPVVVPSVVIPPGVHSGCEQEPRGAASKYQKLSHIDLLV